VLLVVALVLSFPVYARIKGYVNGIKNEGAKKRIYVLGGIAMLVLFAVSVAYLVSDTYNPFLYFRF
jgi:hypothetical protein